MHIRVDAAPQLIQPLLSYQATILEATVNYHTTAWLSYDKKFRRTMANLPDLHRFNCIDSHLWQSCFISRGRPACTRCQIIHPIPSPQCPFRGGGGGGLSLHPDRVGTATCPAPFSKASKSAAISTIALAALSCAIAHRSASAAAASTPRRIAPNLLYSPPFQLLS